MIWDTLSTPWQACLDEAWSAYCSRCVPVGAVITDANGDILTRGRNRITGDSFEPGHLYGHPLAHAEINALINLDYENLDPHVCIMYTTTEPCPLCMGALYMSGVRQLHYASRDPYAGSTNLLNATPYLSYKPIKVFGPNDDFLELFMMAISVEYALRDGNFHQKVFDHWEKVIPRGVNLGKALFRSQELINLKASRLPVSAAFNNTEVIYRSGF